MLFVLVTFVWLIGIQFLAIADGTEWMEVTGAIATIFTGVVLVILIIAMPVSRMEDNSNIAAFKQVQTTIETARASKDISAIELAAIQQKVIEMNQWLAKTQYYQKNIWIGIFDSPKVKDLKPIR